MDGQTRLDGVLLTVDEMVEVLESATTSPSQSPGAVLCCVEKILMRCCTGIIFVEALLVNRWFNKLLRFSSVEESGQNFGEGRRTLYEVRAVCDIGEGVAGTVASTGKAQFIRDSSAELGHSQSCRRAPGRAERGSRICLPVLKNRPDNAAFSGADLFQDHQGSSVANDGSSCCSRQKEDGSSGRTSVLAVLQVYSSGEIPAKVVDLLHSIARILSPILRSVLDYREEEIHRCEAESLYHLSSIVPRQVGLVEMIEKVITATKHLTGAERVCLFFVDDAAQELWVAKSVEFHGAKVKIGQGLCGYSASTGRVVNVINCYEDDRFDRSFDEQTGFLTKSVLCVPIPIAEEDPSLFRPSSMRSSVDDGRTPDRREMPVVCESTAGLGNPVDGNAEVAVEGGNGASSSCSSSTAKQSTGTRSRPFAVMEVLNKQGGGVFDEAEQRALARLCSEVERLLRRKAADVAMLKSSMKEHSCYRSGKTSDCKLSVEARVERSIMQLYSDSTSTDVIWERKRELVPWGDRYSPSLPKRRFSTEQEGIAMPGDGALGPCSNGKTPRAATSDNLPGSHGPSPRPPHPPIGDTMCTDSIPQKEPDLTDWDLDMFSLSSTQQLCLIQRHYRSLGLTERFQISEETLGNFVRAVRDSYNDLPFHNLTHAVSVAHATFVIIKTTRVDSILRPLDKLALLTAAFCHDLDHPGNNNDFEVSTRSALALQHGFSSVLERHHIHMTFKILLKEGDDNNILSNLTQSEVKEAHQLIQQAILASDMSQHMQHCAEVADYAAKAKALRNGEKRLVGSVGRRVSICFAGSPSRREPLDATFAVIKSNERMGRLQAPSKNERAEGVSPELSAAKRSRVSGIDGGGLRVSRRASAPDANLAHLRASSLQRKKAGMQPEDMAKDLLKADKPEDRIFLVKNVLHCADLSGQMLNIRLAREWGERIMREFKMQADMEAKAGVPSKTVVPKDEEGGMKGQHYFLSKIVRPLWESFATIFPELEPLLGNLDLNTECYRLEALRLAALRESREAGKAGGEGESGAGAGADAETEAETEADSEAEGEADGKALSEP